MRDQILDKSNKKLSFCGIELHRVSDTAFESGIVDDKSYGYEMYTKRSMADSYQVRACWYMDFGSNPTVREPKHLSDGYECDMWIFCYRLERKYSGLKVTGLLESEHPLRFRIRVEAE